MPIDIDSTDSGPNSNTLWRDVGLRPQPSQLNHVVRVEVDYPLGLPPQSLEFGAYSTAGTASAPLVNVSGVRIESESTLTRSVYLLNVPVDSLITSARNVALSPLPNDNRLTLEFRPVPPLGSTAPVSPRQFTPNILFNARYKNFVDASDGIRSYYSGNSSSMVSADLAKTILALDTIGATSARPGHTNDFFINDGSLPFGLSFEPDHDGHDDGEKIDVRTFGLEPGSSYESIIRPKGGAINFPAGSRYRDIATLMRITRAADETNRTLVAPLLYQSQCVINSNSPTATNPCLGETTVEQCLFLVAQPALGSSCFAIHASVFNANPVIVSQEESVSSHNRLRHWVLRNREALRMYKEAKLNMNVGASFYYSNGESEDSRRAIRLQIDQGQNFLGKTPPGTVAAKAALIPSNWGVAPLLTGEVPSLVNASGVTSTTFWIVNADGTSLRDETTDLRPLFDFDPTNGHFDHYHLKPEK